MLGDRKGDIFQVMQPSAANSDLSSHLASSDLQHPLRGEVIVRLVTEYVPSPYQFYNPGVLREGLITAVV